MVCQLLSSLCVKWFSFNGSFLSAGFLLILWTAITENKRRRFFVVVAQNTIGKPGCSKTYLFIYLLSFMILVGYYGKG